MRSENPLMFALIRKYDFAYQLLLIDPLGKSP
jgi:hypothetical protein